MLTPIMAMVKEVRNSGQALQHLCGAGEEQQSLRGTGGTLPYAGVWAALSCKGKRRACRSSACHTVSMAMQALSHPCSSAKLSGY